MFAFVQVILILLFILIEVSRIFSGWKGNLTENVGRSQFTELAINNSIISNYIADISPATFIPLRAPAHLYNIASRWH